MRHNHRGLPSANDTPIADPYRPIPDGERAREPLDIGHVARPPQGEAISALERLEMTTDELVASIAEQHQLYSAMVTPAVHRCAQLTLAIPAVREKSGTVHLSYAILNPNSMVVYVAIDGGRPLPGQAGISVPANSLLVLPLAVRDVDIGADPADAFLVAGNTAVVHTFRYATVQPAFLGRGA